MQQTTQPMMSQYVLPVAPRKPSFFARRWVQLVGVALVAFFLGIAMGGAGKAAAPAAAPAAATAKKAAPVKKPAAPVKAETGRLPIADGDWTLATVQVKNDGLGDLGGTARITYTGDNKAGGDALFTVTVFVGGRQVGTLDGSATQVEPGRTQSVTLISSDKFAKGPYSYDFQKTL